MYVCVCVCALALAGRRQSEEAELVTWAARKFLAQEINNCSEASGDGALICAPKSPSGLRAVIT